jgi:hypothetical protein
MHLIPNWHMMGTTRESSHICIEIFLLSLFRHSISGCLDLRQVTLFSNHGYWTPTLVYWLLSSGAFVVGTFIHVLCWPIPICQKKKENDLKTFLNPKGTGEQNSPFYTIFPHFAYRMGLQYGDFFIFHISEWGYRF